MKHNRFTVPFRSFAARLSPDRAHPHRFRFPQGHHYALFPQTQPFRSLTGGLSFQFRFHENCLYDFQERADWARHHDAINKVIGISRGPHKWNSIRIGWRRAFVGDQLQEELELFAYCYLRSRRTYFPLLCVSPEQWVRGMLYFGQRGFGVRFPERGWERHWQFETSLRQGLMLYPFFGGRLPAPQEMHLDVQHGFTPYPPTSTDRHIPAQWYDRSPPLDRPRS